MFILNGVLQLSEMFTDNTRVLQNIKRTIIYSSSYMLVKFINTNLASNIKVIAKHALFVIRWLLKLSLLRLHIKAII